MLKVHKSKSRDFKKSGLPGIYPLPTPNKALDNHKLLVMVMVMVMVMVLDFWEYMEGGLEEKKKSRIISGQISIRTKCPIGDCDDANSDSDDGHE